MQLSGRPLLDNAADHALFVGRQAELRRLDRSLRSGLNCAVIGDPGSGKTSLIRALMYRAHQAGDDLRFRYARANDARTAVELLTAVLDAGAAGQRVAGPSRRSAPIDLVGELTREVAGAGTGPNQVIVVEDVSAIAGSEVFGALRDELWQVDARWLVTASSTQAAGLLRPPADAFFETSIELGPLTGDEATELLRRRFDDTAPAELFELLASAMNAGGQTPRRLLETAREVAAEPAVGGAALTVVQGLRARTEALEQASRPARMLAQELDAIGWASASDEQLLARMGWTRPRVVQVIGELENRGLVQMREESTGRGRPRKMYRLVPGKQFGRAHPEAGRT